MITAVLDVHYVSDEDGVESARAAAAVYPDERCDRLILDRTVTVRPVAPYRPGAFFERELPALAAVLATISGAGPAIELLVIDGYVDLDPAGRPGLGAHAHKAFGLPVVGVAKTAFRAATHAVPVVRGIARKPVFVTAAGLDGATAAALVAAMAGAFRLPDAVRHVDALARGRVPATRA